MYVYVCIHVYSKKVQTQMDNEIQNGFIGLLDIYLCMYVERQIHR